MMNVSKFLLIVTIFVFNLSLVNATEETASLETLPEITEEATAPTNNAQVPIPEDEYLIDSQTWDESTGAQGSEYSNIDYEEL